MIYVVGNIQQIMLSSRDVSIYQSLYILVSTAELVFTPFDKTLISLNFYHKLVLLLLAGQVNQHKF